MTGSRELIIDNAPESEKKIIGGEVKLAEGRWRKEVEEKLGGGRGGGVRKKLVMDELGESLRKRELGEMGRIGGARKREMREG